MYKLLYVVLLIIGSGVYAAGIPQIGYLKKHDFLAQTFEQTPKWKMLRLKGDVKKRVEAILKHPYSSKRIRYWRDGDQLKAEISTLDEATKRRFTFIPCPAD